MRKTYQKCCEICNTGFLSIDNRKLCCSRSCGNKLAYKRGRRRDWGLKKGLFDHWDETCSEEVASLKKSEFRRNMSNAIKSADMSVQKAKASKHFTAINRMRKGKKFEEIFGEVRAAQIRETFSKSKMGSKNSAFGKVYRNSGRSVKGYYKEKFFRSLLELSYLLHVESLGISVSTIEYECFSIPWVDDKGSQRTYKIDFFLPEYSVAVEIKQSFALQNRDNILKWSSAQDFFNKINVEFAVVTERDISKISFQEAQNNPCVFLDERSFKGFRRRS
jgi:hypothetical protein